MEFDQKKLSGKEIHKIDRSTTYHRLYNVDCDILMDKFAKTTHPNYRPVDGYGYYEIPDISKFSEAENHLRIVILMNEV